MNNYNYLQIFIVQEQNDAYWIDLYKKYSTKKKVKLNKDQIIF